jgi:16S rRNA (cytidine1402-2'-O)-methyltransferase
VTAGKLFVVATPIGNLKDITLRAVDALTSATTIAAEDTRRTRALLRHLHIAGKRVESLNAHSTDADVERIAARLADGSDVAVVTDAGTPLVSDPGDALVAAALRIGADVVAIPGPSAVLGALVLSGLSQGAGFRFVAFLPRDGRKRREAIERISETPEPVVLFESPLRLAATLRELAEATPDRRACVVRELTKLHEEAVRGSLAELARVERTWRGEITVVLGAFSPEAREAIDEGAIDARIREELGRGLHAKAVAEKIAAWSGRPRRELYARVVTMKSGAAREPHKPGPA